MEIRGRGLVRLLARLRARAALAAPCDACTSAHVQPVGLTTFRSMLRRARWLERLQAHSTRRTGRSLEQAPMACRHRRAAMAVIQKRQAKGARAVVAGPAYPRQTAWTCDLELPFIECPGPRAKAMQPCSLTATRPLAVLAHAPRRQARVDARARAGQEWEQSRCEAYASIAGQERFLRFLRWREKITISFLELHYHPPDMDERVAWQSRSLYARGR